MGDEIAESSNYIMDELYILLCVWLHTIVHLFNVIKINCEGLCQQNYQPKTSKGK